MDKTLFIFHAIGESMTKRYEIRDPIHGFIKIDEWERDIINHSVFQRLRRIRQLGFTDMVYPGAMHARFEHSLGVMHLATKMFNEIVARRKDFLKSTLHYTETGIDKDRIIIRFASLLHDLGHAPFSHAAEGLMDINPDTGKPYKHENYSAAIVELLMSDVIENHPLNQNYGFKAKDIANILNNDISSASARSLLWRNLVSSQLDADRADYLLRDSHHIGVAYGNFDINRLLVTLTVALDDEDNAILAIEKGGEHAAEALLLARYMMFTQVYFQHTRIAYDHHSVEAIKHLLKENQKDSGLDNIEAFPPPTTVENLKKYIEWDDWKVFGDLKKGMGEKHGSILLNRNHYRCVFETPEIPDIEDLESFEKAQQLLLPFESFVDCAEKSWYKMSNNEIPILYDQMSNGKEKLINLSRLSPVVAGLKSVARKRIYVNVRQKEAAKQAIKGLTGNTEKKS